MRNNPNLKYFDYKEVRAVTYIQVTDDIKQLIKRYSGMIIKMHKEDTNFNIKHNRFFGEFNIGFWE